MIEPQQELVIDEKIVGEKHPTYFVADIAANHDGDIGRAKDLIWMAKEAGADAAKFQHFSADTIVSDRGFRNLGDQQTHQAQWKKSVFDVYKDASVSLDWSPILKETSVEAGISFFTSPYDFELVDAIDPYVPAYKIGSGDITWLEIIRYIAHKAKPYILATGASSMTDVNRAVAAALEINPQIALLQCNTNYTGSVENMRYVQLNVLKCYRAMYPTMVLGLSDHTAGHASVLGAVSLGARIVEKHFTDDTTREGPDHAFSMNPGSWKGMVEATRELEAALGNGIKRIEENERETVVLQRRALRAKRDIATGEILDADNIAVLRPCPDDAIPPFESHSIIGRVLRRSVKAGTHFRINDFE